MSKYYKAEDVAFAIADRWQFESEVGRPYEVFLNSAKDLLKDLPTVEVSEDTNSRQAAIEAIEKAYCNPCKERGDDHNEVRCRACNFDDAINQIDALPPVLRPVCEDAISKRKLMTDLQGIWDAYTPQQYDRFSRYVRGHILQNQERTDCNTASTERGRY